MQNICANVRKNDIELIKTCHIYNLFQNNLKVEAIKQLQASNSQMHFKIYNCNIFGAL